MVVLKDFHEFGGVKENLSHQILEICRVEQIAISVLERAIN